MFETFQEYWRSSVGGIFTNELFIGIILALIASDLRTSKYFKWEDHFRSPYLKIIFFILSYVFLIPATLLILFLIIFVLWVISLLM